MNAGRRCVSGWSMTTRRSAGCWNVRCATAACRPGSLKPQSRHCSRCAAIVPDVLITDVRMSGQSGIDLLKRVRSDSPGDAGDRDDRIHSDLGAAVTAYGSGAFEYLPKPFDVDQAVDLVRRAAHSGDEAHRACCECQRGAASPSCCCKAPPAMQQVFRAIGRLSRSSVNVLITGESGTGKELVARALHEHSPRAGKPFIALNTSAIPAELLESELFGHEKGSFTGADSQRRGRFEQADGGTLFLDEIGDMSVALQTRLLRVLAEGEFYRVGGQTADQGRCAGHCRYPPESGGAFA